MLASSLFMCQTINKGRTDLPFCQCIDTVAQRQQRPVDVGAFSESRTPIGGDRGAL